MKRCSVILVCLLMALTGCSGESGRSAVASPRPTRLNTFCRDVKTHHSLPPVVAKFGVVPPNLPPADERIEERDAPLLDQLLKLTLAQDRDRISTRREARMGEPQTARRVVNDEDRLAREARPLLKKLGMTECEGVLFIALRPPAGG